MRSTRTLRAVLAVSLCALATAAGAAASGEEARGIDPNQGDSLVEFTLPSKAAAMRLQLGADAYGVEFNEHYLRRNADGSVVVTIFGTEDELAKLEAAGYERGATIESPETWRQRIAEREAAIRAERRARALALKPGRFFTHTDEVVILRADYFQNYAGRFLSVEAKSRQAHAQNGVPTLTLSYNAGAGTELANPRTMSVNIDPDTTPDTYVEHRELVRIGGVGSPTPAAPTLIRVASSNGGVAEAPVSVWLGGGLPPHAAGYLSDFTTRYLDPTELYARFGELAAEFPNISRLIELPNKTNGYQRRAQATMSGLTLPGNTPPTSQQSGAVVLTSRAWGHEGGNDITAAFRNPGTPDSSLSVVVIGKDIVVNLATNSTGATTSTAAQVVDAINANGAAAQLVVARTFRGSAGSGIVQPRAQVNLSDFLTTATNAHVKRGPFTYSVMHIGKPSPGNRPKVGVFLYCQQHAREWATPLTCLETAEQLLRNYAIDVRVKQMVDALDIYILPSSNPDGSHYSIHNSARQRRNMTDHCVIGGKSTDDPFAANFWTPAGAPVTNTHFNDPAARNDIGVDLNRNNTFGTFFDGYIGASSSCISDVFAGPSEASEPEIKNEFWIADTFKNIKFSNNIHSFGGYFMWAPGTYLPDRGEGDAVHANIGVEKYFFLAGDRILNRIKDVRNTAILPERTGPIADVLYSAAGNSADEHWYNRGVIAYSFETGADRYFTNTTAASAAGAPGIRISTNTVGFGYLKPGDVLTVDVEGTAETRTVASVVRPNPPAPNPNVLFTEPLTATHASGARVEGAALQTGVGFQPPYATEGKFEALEFAAGNFGLLESALAYARDDEAPEVTMTGPTSSNAPIETTFEWVNEPSVIRYTTDGSKPTESSQLWDATGPREPGQVFHVSQTTTFRWMATDMKGNVSTGQKRFVINP